MTMNNLHFENYYLENTMNIEMFKSERKGAKSTYASFQYKVKADGEKLTDSEVLDEFHNLLKWVYVKSLNFNNALVFQCSLYLHSPVEYQGVKCAEQHNLFLGIEKYGTFARATTVLFNYFRFLYPYSTLSIYQVHDDERIKYLIENHMEKTLMEEVK